MTGNEHRHWTAEEKLQIIEEARQTGQMVSEVCRRVSGDREALSSHHGL